MRYSASRHEIWGDMGRYGEIWGDMGRDRNPYSASRGWCADSLKYSSGWSFANWRTYVEHISPHLEHISPYLEHMSSGWAFANWRT